MRRFALPLFALACLLCAAHAPAHAKDAWTSVRTNNFFLVGNASEKEIKQVATRLEQFREVFTRLFAGANFRSAVPTTVVVFKNDAAYKPFKPVVDGKVSEVSGYFQPGEDVNYITLTPSRGGENPFDTIYHEYVHMILDNSFGSDRVPAWFNEGMAEYYSTFDIEEGRKVWLGKLIENHLLLLRQSRLLPLQTLFSVDYYSLHRNRRDAKGLFYAQSWALVHYLILGNEGKRRPQVGQFLKALAANKPIEAAFRESFQTDFAAMEKELREYVEARRFRAEVATFEHKLEFDAEMQSATLSEAEAETYLGDLLLHTDRAAEAVKRLEAALALDPRHGPAHAALGMAYMRLGLYDEAKRHLREAVAGNARNYLAHYYYAYTLSREAMQHNDFGRGYTAETARAMRDALRKAIELKPDFPESYQLLAFVYLATGEDVEEGVRLINRARALAPGNPHYAIILAQLYLRQGKYDEARAAVEPLTRETADPELRGPARSILAQIDSYREQTARHEAARAEAARADREAPRLVRRDEPAGDGPAKSDEERIAEAMNESLNEALRKPQAGEARAEGVLQSVECDAKGLVFVVRVGERTLRLSSPNFEGVHIMAFTREAGSSLTCGARKSASRVVVTYRPAPDARAKADGAIAALEFVPHTFKLAR